MTIVILALCALAALPLHAATTRPALRALGLI